MIPENDFENDAFIEITLPAQLSVEEPSVSIGASLTTLKSVDVDVRFNRILTITPKFETKSNEEFFLTVTGFKNPPTTQETDAFDIQIYY